MDFFRAHHCCGHYWTRTIMLGKITGYFLISFLLLNPSYGFLADKCNIQLNLAKLFGKVKIEAKDVLQGAAIFSQFFHENPGYSQKFPSTHKLVNDLVHHGTSIITAVNLAYVGASIYLGAVVLTSYCYLIHSRKQLAEVQSLENKLNLITEEEVARILQSIETLLNARDDRTGRQHVCDVKDEAMKMLKDRILIIQNINNDIKVLRSQLIEGEEQSKALQFGTVIGFSVALVILPCYASAIVAVGSAWGFFQFQTSKMTYRQALELLDTIKDKAIAAERALTLLHTKVETACLVKFKNLA